MAVQGGIIERKEIGMGISLTGEFYNTEVVDGRLQLKKINESSYYSNGYFISSIIDIGDNFREFDNIISTIESVDESLVIISTRTSDNSLEFTPWEVLDEENKIKSSKKRYIQVRVELSAITESVDNFLELSEYVTDENEGFLEIDRQGDDGYVQLELTSNAVTDMGFPFGTNEESSAYTYYRAFTTNKSVTFRVANANKNNYYLGYNFSVNRKITKYKITTTSEINTLPVSWTLQASNDTTTGLDGTWVDLHVVNETVWSTLNEIKEFEFINNTKYKAYRIHVTKGGSGTNYNEINTLEFYEKSDEFLKLKDEFSYNMIDDESWSEEGNLYRKLVIRDEWIRIDKLEVI